MTYFLRKTTSFALTLSLLLVSVFFLLRMAPGGPFDGEKALPPEILENLSRYYGLDRPIWEQFLTWMQNLLKGDLGESFQYIGRPVSELLGESIGVSLAFGSISLVLSFGVGTLWGSQAGYSPGSNLDRAASFLLSIGNSLPSYLTAGLLVLIFSKWLNLLPPALLDEPGSWVLPVITLSIRPVCLILQHTRTSISETLRADYIRTALAKGASSQQMLLHHALRNSWIPLIGLLGPMTSNLLTGSFLVETVFQLPGLGKHFVSAVINRDYPLVMGVTLLYGVLLLSMTWVSDLLYGWADPRIRFASADESETGRAG